MIKVANGIFVKESAGIDAKRLATMYSAAPDRMIQHFSRPGGYRDIEEGISKSMIERAIKGPNSGLGRDGDSLGVLRFHNLARQEHNASPLNMLINRRAAAKARGTIKPTASMRPSRQSVDNIYSVPMRDDEVMPKDWSRLGLPAQKAK